MLIANSNLVPHWTTSEHFNEAVRRDIAMYGQMTAGLEGMGSLQHSGMVTCCNGSEDADRRIANVLWNDPATGVMRRADAGYRDVPDCAREAGTEPAGTPLRLAPIRRTRVP